MTEHAILGASSAYRWIACPGSVRLCRGIVAPPSPFALEGTVAHDVLAWCLKGGHSAEEAIDRPIVNFVKDKDTLDLVAKLLPDLRIDAEMAEAVQVHIDEVVGRLDNSALLQIETRIDLAPLNPPAPMFGTADTIVYYRDSGLLRVIDFKYGRGVPVEVEGNHQLRYYALGAWFDQQEKHRAVTSVEAVIVQPRSPHRDGPVRREVVDPMELYEWSADLLGFAAETQKPDAPLVPGDHCRFCAALPTCPAVRARALAVAQVEFAALPDVVVPDAKTLSPAEVARILDGLDMLETWCKAVKGHAMHLCDIGTPPPGYKAVERYGHRKWIDEIAASVAVNKIQPGLTAAKLYTEPELRSPAQVEKLLSNAARESDAFKALIEKPTTGKTLVKADSDERPAVARSAAIDFAREVDAVETAMDLLGI